MARRVQPVPPLFMQQESLWLFLNVDLPALNEWLNEYAEISSRLGALVTRSLLEKTKFHASVYHSQTF